MQEKSASVEISVEHVRAARGLLRWTQEELAKRSGVTNVTISGWESEKTRPMQETKDQIRRAFEAAGVEFTNGDSPGVRWNRHTREQ